MQAFIFGVIFQRAKNKQAMQFHLTLTPLQTASNLHATFTRVQFSNNIMFSILLWDITLSKHAFGSKHRRFTMMDGEWRLTLNGRRRPRIHP
jgi:hypothetical protein